MRAVSYVSGQFAIILTAMLAVGTMASATTTSAKPKHHSTSASSHKKSTSSNTQHVSKASSHSSRGKRGRRVVKSSWKSKGQHGITSDRTREIQQALIQQHYLDGEASGVWDTRTQEACRKYQADNGWQAKVLPDSRALIKLGLGPDHKDVLNPETAATSPYLPGGGVRSNDAIAPATTASAPQPER